MSFVATSGIPVRWCRRQSDSLTLVWGSRPLRCSSSQKWSAEQLAQVRRDRFGLALLLAQIELVDLAREAAREARDAGGVLREQRHVDPRAEVIPVDVRLGRETDEVLVAGLVARDQRQVAVPVAFLLVVLLAHRLLGDVHLAADQRLHAVLGAL